MWLQTALSKVAAIPAVLEHGEQIMLLSPHELAKLCSHALGSSPSIMHIRRMQKLVTAVARVPLRQRMQLVFAGYHARFLKIGVVVPGNLVCKIAMDTM